VVGVQLRHDPAEIAGQAGEIPREIVEIDLAIAGGDGDEDDHHDEADDILPPTPRHFAPIGGEQLVDLLLRQGWKASGHRLSSVNATASAVIPSCPDLIRASNRPFSVADVGRRRLDGRVKPGHDE
jgi:hypothetical protein